MKTGMQIFIVALIALSAASCGKEQQVLNKLEGRWKLTDITSNGGPFCNGCTIAGPDIEFDACKPKDDVCTCTFYDTPPATSTYEVSKDGKWLTLSGDTANKRSIVKLTDESLVLGLDIYQLFYEKQ